jgi:phosphohistidine phosphatase
MFHDAAYCCGYPVKDCCAQKKARLDKGNQPLDDVTKIAGGFYSEQNLMLIGHLPFMERLTSYLITGSPDKKVIKFQNGGIVCLDTEPETGHWFIKWALMPRID